MFEFLADLSAFSFLQYALLTGVLVSVACGIIGSYVTVRRVSYIAGALAHCTLGGMGAARYLHKEHGILFLTPLTGALIAALAAALLISWLQQQRGERQDSLLSMIWATGMATGILFISQTSGYNEDLMSYLFGDILMVSPKDILLIAVLDIIIATTAFLFHNRLTALSFDETFASISGIRTGLYNTIFLCLIALTVVLLVQVVGIILVVALLTLPAAAAGQLTARLAPMMLLAMFLSMISCIGGLALSYSPDLPTGATIILVAAGLYLLCGLAGRVRRKRFFSRSR